MRERVRAAITVLSTAFRASPLLALLVLLMNLGVSLSQVTFAVWIKLLVDGATHRSPGTVTFAAVAMAVNFALTGLAGLGQYVLAQRLTDETAQAFDEEIMRTSATLPGIEHHERPEYLDKINLLRMDRGVVAGSVWAVFTNIGLVAQIVTSVAVLARLDVLLLLLPVFAVPYVWLGGKAQVLALNAAEKAAEPARLAYHLRELGTMPGPAKEVRIGQLRQLLLKHHREANEAALAPLARAQRAGALYNAAGALIFAAGFIGAIALVVVKASRGQLTLGDVVLALGLAASINWQLAQTVSSLSFLLQTLRGVGRFLWLRDYATTARLAHPGRLPVPAAVSRGLSIEGLTFRYPGTEVDVLNDVSLEVPAGATVAIVGENGAGKTSLVKLLNRFYEPTSGTIRLDGVDIREFDLDQWRERHSACFQDFAQFAFQVREVVGIGDLPRIDDLPRVERALAEANATEVPAGLERGLETQLTKRFDGGVELSGGQWQKLALGRAMMRDAPLLLALDEPSSGLDAQAEHSLFERYAGAARRGKVTNGAITVLVSHRFSTVRMADLIVVIDGGRLLEVGTHDELMRKGGLYAELYEIQASAYR